MTIIIAIILIAIFLFLSGLHVYWGFGGKWGNGAVIPTKDDNTKVMIPGPLPTFIVALGLLSFGAVVFLSITELDFKTVFLLEIVHNYGLWVIASIFILRAIGDFNYVGFFKKKQKDKIWI